MSIGNFLQVAIYFEPDQSVITKITKDAKMTWSDKISWVGTFFFFFFGWGTHHNNVPPRVRHLSID